MLVTAKFVTRKVATTVVLLIAVTFLTFSLLSLTPDPSKTLLGRLATPAQLAAKRAELGLDQPLIVRYFEWVIAALHGDFGTSWYSGLPVSGTIAGAFPITLSLAVVATLVSAIIGVTVGMTAATRGGWLDKALQAVSSLAFAIPGLWLALLLVIVFAVTFRILPATGYIPLAQDPVGWLRSLILPVVSIALGSIAAIANQVRSDVDSLLWQDWYRTLRSRGLPRRRLLLVHLLRNAAPRTLTIIGLQFISLFGGALIIEQIFALQGLGSVAVDATLKSDTPVVLAVALVGTLIVLVVNAAVDLASGWLDPKERLR